MNLKFFWIAWARGSVNGIWYAFLKSLETFQADLRHDNSRGVLETKKFLGRKIKLNLKWQLCRESERIFTNEFSRR